MLQSTSPRRLMTHLLHQMVHYRTTLRGSEQRSVTIARITIHTYATILNIKRKSSESCAMRYLLRVTLIHRQGWVQEKRPAQPFVPVGATNRDKRPPFCPGWWLQPGQNSLAPLSLPLSPRPSHSAHLFSCCSWLGIEGVLAHFFTTFVKIFDSPSIHRR